MTTQDPKQLVQQQFGAAAQRYVESAFHAYGSDLVRMVALAELQGNERVLDVATGGGHTALAFAPHVREVIATDLTERMLEVAEAFVRSQNATNVSFQRADAEALPFPDQSFDVVTVRVAPHHFPNLNEFVREVARVLRPGGIFVFNDNVAPENAELAAWINRVEQWRDPSHVRSLPASEWRTLMEAAGLRVEVVETDLRKQFVFAPWVERMSMPEAGRAALESWMIAAQPWVAQAFDLVIENERVISFASDFVIMKSKK